jgi:hypothetical protein
VGGLWQCGRYRNVQEPEPEPERNRPLEMQRHRWEDYIKVDVEERGLDNVDRIRLVQ